MENELKLQLTFGVYNAIASFADGAKPKKQTNHYFDTTDDLNRMVRIRQTDEGCFLQFKLRHKAEGGVFTSDEHGKKVDEEFLRTAMKNGLKKEYVNDAFGCRFASDLKYLGCGVTERLKFDLFGFLIELDKTTVGKTVDYELEFEGSDEDIAKLKDYLQDEGVHLVPSEAKLQRFLKIKGII